MKLINLICTSVVSLYITGTINRVRIVEKVKPKITVHAMGPQNNTCGPPKYRFGEKLENNPWKSMFSPTASGKSPNIVVIAVNNTGRSLVFPA